MLPIMALQLLRGLMVREEQKQDRPKREHEKEKMAGDLREILLFGGTRRAGLGGEKGNLMSWQPHYGLMERKAGQIDKPHNPSSFLPPCYA